MRELDKLNLEADSILNRVNHKPILLFANASPSFVRKCRPLFGNNYSILTVKDFVDLLRIVSTRPVSTLIWRPGCDFSEYFYQIQSIKEIVPRLIVYLLRNERPNIRKPKIEAGSEGRDCNDFNLPPADTMKSARPIDDIYRELKSQISHDINHDIQQNRLCRYSILFDQGRGDIISDSQSCLMGAKQIGQDRNILPLCAISKELVTIKNDDKRRICPFHLDINPKLKPEKYNIGYVSSYKCIFYELAAAGITPNILKTTKPFPHQNQGIQFPRILNILVGEIKSRMKSPEPALVIDQH